MNYSLVNTAHNIGKANRSFRGNSSPTSTHSFARRLDAKQAALEDWESSFSQILSRTKQNIIKVNERYGSPHGQNVHPTSLSSSGYSTSRMSTLEHLGISSLRGHRKIGTESTEQSSAAGTSTHKLADQVLLMQRLDRLEHTVLHHHQSDVGDHDADSGKDTTGLGQDESKNDPPRSSPYKTNNNANHPSMYDSTNSSSVRTTGGSLSLRGGADLSLNSFERRVALLESRVEQMHVQVTDHPCEHIFSTSYDTIDPYTSQHRWTRPAAMCVTASVTTLPSSPPSPSTPPRSTTSPQVPFPLPVPVFVLLSTHLLTLCCMLFVVVCQSWRRGSPWV